MTNNEQDTDKSIEPLFFKTTDEKHLAEVVFREALTMLRRSGKSIERYVYAVCIIHKAISTTPNQPDNKPSEAECKLGQAYDVLCRIGLGAKTTQEEIDRVLNDLLPILAPYIKFSPDNKPVDTPDNCCSKCCQHDCCPECCALQAGKCKCECVDTPDAQQGVDVRALLDFISREMQEIESKFKRRGGDYSAIASQKIAYAKVETYLRSQPQSVVPEVSGVVDVVKTTKIACKRLETTLSEHEIETILDIAHECRYHPTNTENDTSNNDKTRL